jgi:hypothetical protein
MEAPERDAASPKSPARAPEDRSTLGTGRNAVEGAPAYRIHGRRHRGQRYPRRPSSNRAGRVMADKRRRGPGHAATAVRRSAVHGSGLFAVRDIAAGQQLGVYEGRRYGSVAEREWDPRRVYVFGLSDGTFIDGSEGGNELRRINHSCEPNCAAYEVEQADGTLAIVIETLRCVQRGEELLLDYALDVDPADAGDFACRCGAATCRGTMVAG